MLLLKALRIVFCDTDPGGFSSGFLYGDAIRGEVEYDRHGYWKIYRLSYFTFGVVMLQDECVGMIDLVTPGHWRFVLINTRNNSYLDELGISGTAVYLDVRF